MARHQYGNTDDVAEMLRNSADEFVAAADAGKRLRALRLLDDGFDGAGWKQFAQLGWLGLRLPEGCGGSGLELRHALVLAERFGASLLPEPYVACALMPSALLLHLPPSAAREHLMNALAVGREVITVGWQESPNQTGVTGSGTTLRRQGPGHFALRGTKLFVAGGATVYLVPADFEGQPSVVAVPAASAGLRSTSQRMADGSITDTLSFDEVSLKEGAILATGPVASEALEAAIREATLAISAQLEGNAGGALRKCIDFLAMRVQFDRPLAENQAIRHRVADLAMHIELAGASLRNAVRSHESSPAARAGEAAIAAAKARCSETALLVGRGAIQLHGAIGYTDDIDIGLHLKSALRWSSWLGNGRTRRLEFLATTDLEALAR